MLARIMFLMLIIGSVNAAYGDDIQLMCNGLSEQAGKHVFLVGINKEDGLISIKDSGGYLL